MNQLIEQAQLVASALPLLACLGVLVLWVVLSKVLRLQDALSVELHRTRNLQANVVVNHGESQLAIDDTLIRLEKKLAEITDRVFELQSQAAINASFEEACRLARDGVPARKLVQACGLSDGEAELMVRVHADLHRG